ncbi:AAA family ATPase [Oryzibacter oryziterrae]|uniref:AAA family ATPase n=1 Tax=Oryzibacter oryziterrae TaxID=2766474 RepID=UPI001F2F73BC|nr:response regulator receiver protein [Oryzibacter oryziterrae]
MTLAADTPLNVVVITDEKELAVTVSAALRASALPVGNLTVRAPDKLTTEVSDPDCHLVIADLDGFPDGPAAALGDLQRMASASVRFVAVTGAFDPDLARAFLRLKLNDFHVKPVAADDLAATLRRAVMGDGDPHPDCNILSFFPCAGGVGNTTLALQTAFLLHERNARHHKTTCLVDLNLQHGSAAEYLDLEPRFDIAEIENQPDRLDRKLLDVMLSRHKSGLAIVSAPHCPWEMRSYRPDLITRLLDLVSTHFDTVVIDLPRTWFPWTDSVLLGSDKVFLVTEMTVPAIRHTQRLASAVRERIGKEGKLGVIVNRVDAKGSANISIKDVREVLGDSYLGSVANDYKAVREALDQGKPLKDVAPSSRILADLNTLVTDVDTSAGPAWTHQLKALIGRLGRTTPAAASAGKAKEKRHA